MAKDTLYSKVQYIIFKNYIEYDKNYNRNSKQFAACKFENISQLQNVMDDMVKYSFLKNSLKEIDKNLKTWGYNMDLFCAKLQNIIKSIEVHPEIKWHRIAIKLFLEESLMPIGEECQNKILIKKINNFLNQLN